MEKWKKVKGFKDYQVSNLGKIRSIPRYVRYSMPERGNFRKFFPSVTLKITLTWNGYCRVGLRKNKKDHPKSIHRIVAIAFIKKIHEDGNKQNNCVKNLEWVTCSENSLHGYRTGLIKPNKPWLGKFGKLCPRSKSIIQFGMDGSIVATHGSIREAMRKLNINYSGGISNCLCGRSKTAYGHTWEYKLSQNCITP